MVLLVGKRLIKQNRIMDAIEPIVIVVKVNAITSIFPDGSRMFFGVHG